MISEVGAHPISKYGDGIASMIAWQQKSFKIVDAYLLARSSRSHCTLITTTCDLEKQKKKEGKKKKEEPQVCIHFIATHWDSCQTCQIIKGEMKRNNRRCMHTSNEKRSYPKKQVHEDRHPEPEKDRYSKITPFNPSGQFPDLHKESHLSQISPVSRSYAYHHISFLLLGEFLRPIRWLPGSTLSWARAWESEWWEMQRVGREEGRESWYSKF